MTDVKKLASDHWQWVEGLLRVAIPHGDQTGAIGDMTIDDLMKLVGYVFTTAMEHGWKHCREDVSGTNVVDIKSTKDELREAYQAGMDSLRGAVRYINKPTLPDGWKIFHSESNTVCLRRWNAVASNCYSVESTTGKFLRDLLKEIECDT